MSDQPACAVRILRGNKFVTCPRPVVPGERFCDKHLEVPE